MPSIEDAAFEAFAMGGSHYGSPLKPARHALPGSAPATPPPGLRADSESSTPRTSPAPEVARLYGGPLSPPLRRDSDLFSAVSNYAPGSQSGRGPASAGGGWRPSGTIVGSLGPAPPPRRGAARRSLGAAGLSGARGGALAPGDECAPLVPGGDTDGTDGLSLAARPAAAAAAAAAADDDELREWRRRAAAAERDAELYQTLAAQLKGELDSLRAAVGRSGVRLADAGTPGAPGALELLALGCGLVPASRALGGPLGRLAARERAGQRGGPEAAWRVRGTPGSVAAAGRALEALADLGLEDAGPLVGELAAGAERDLAGCERDGDLPGALFWLSWAAHLAAVLDRWPAAARIAAQAAAGRGGVAGAVRRLSLGDPARSPGGGRAGRPAHEAVASVAQSALAAAARVLRRRVGGAPGGAAGAAAGARGALGEALAGCRAARLPPAAAAAALRHLAAHCDHALASRAAGDPGRGAAEALLAAARGMAGDVAASLGAGAGAGAGALWALPRTAAAAGALAGGGALEALAGAAPDPVPAGWLADARALGDAVTDLAAPGDPVPLPGFTEPALPRPLFDFLAPPPMVAVGGGSGGPKDKDA